ncbi:hypothetical protein N431DRAFT_547356 [Stipitochalara longipes BDJ]|nr:hypothetical protein N431DRAFT_547356 [Stipitochalara longipes BDJ]
MSGPITRITMVKIPEDKLDLAFKGFEIFVKNQQKDGKPYILTMQAGRADGHIQMEQGFTFVARSVFKDMEDVKYYIEKCEAHQAFKAYLKENAPPEGLMSLVFTPQVSCELEKSS